MKTKEPGVGSQESGAEVNPAVLSRIVSEGLTEDRAEYDITTSALVPSDQDGRAAIVAKVDGVLAGVPLAQAVFSQVDGSLSWQEQKVDGDRVAAGEAIARVDGALHSILRGERVALNFLAHLSGIASMTAAVVAQLEGTNCRLRDTRKTTPGLRALEKYAVRMGGGTNHRMDLADGVLIKDNHLAALRVRGLGIADAVALARKANARIRIEVEVTNVEEARQAIDAGADELLLDNMSLEEMRKAVALAAKREPRAMLEASGGITLSSARVVAETGVDYISMGAITHSAPALDLSLEVEG